MANNENTRAPAGGSQTCGAPDECPFCEPHERCAPLPLTEDWSKPAMAAADQSYKAPARECLAAAPVADERATVRKLIAEFGHGHVVPRNDGSRARCTGTAACKTCQMEAAALSGGSPEPVSGSEGEEEGRTR